MWLCSALTKHTATMIGKRFGGRDHSTVAYAWRQAEARMEADPALKAEVEALQAAIAASASASSESDAVLQGRALAMLDQARIVEDEAARLRSMATAMLAAAGAGAAPPG